MFNELSIIVPVNEFWHSVNEVCEQGIGIAKGVGEWNLAKQMHVLTIYESRPQCLR